MEDSKASHDTLMLSCYLGLMKFLIELQLTYNINFRCKICNDSYLYILWLNDENHSLLFSKAS